MPKPDIQEFLTPKDFGSSTFLGDDPRIDEFTPKERLYISAWRHACPQPDGVVAYYGQEWLKWWKEHDGKEQPEPSVEEIETHGIAITRRRYDECDFVTGDVLEKVKAAGKNELYAALTTPKTRLSDEPVGYYEPGRVPASHEHEMSSLSGLVLYALSRTLIEEIGWGDDERTWGGERSWERYDKALNILDEAISRAATPAQLLAIVAESVTVADGDADRVLGHVLSDGIEKEENNHTEYAEVKEAMSQFSPILWSHYQDTLAT